MNRTTVKRGIGAVILALIAAALLAFLLKDKAAQRQEVVEIALPGTEEGTATTNQTTRLPTLTTDNNESSSGNVIANAGSGTGGDGSNNGTGNNTSASSATTAVSTGTTDGTASSNSDGTIIASAAAVGTAAAAGAAATAASAAKSVDFSVKPKAATSASSEFLDLDLVNNGTTSGTASTSASSVASSTVKVAPTQAAATQDTGKSDQGTVIASTAPKSSRPNPNTVQPRLIGEKRATPVKSSNTARVVTKKATTKTEAASTQKNTSSASATKQAKNGYAIQLLATSSQTRANNLKKVMAGEGYPAYVTKTKQNGKTLFRVRIGQYSAKSAALKAQAQMKRRYKKNTNVNRSAVVAR